MIDIKEEVTESNFDATVKKELGSYSKYFKKELTGFWLKNIFGLKQSDFEKECGFIPFRAHIDKVRGSNKDEDFSISSFCKIRFSEDVRDFYFTLQISVLMNDPKESVVYKELRRVMLKHFKTSNIQENTSRYHNRLMLVNYANKEKFELHSASCVERTVALTKDIIDLMKKLSRKKRGVLKV